MHTLASTPLMCQSQLQELRCYVQMSASDAQSSKILCTDMTDTQLAVCTTQ